MSDDENSDYKLLVDNPGMFETFIDDVKKGYSKKMNLVKAGAYSYTRNFFTKRFCKSDVTSIRGELLRPNSFPRRSTSNSTKQQ